MFEYVGATDTAVREPFFEIVLSLIGELLTAISSPTMELPLGVTKGCTVEFIDDGVKKSGIVGKRLLYSYEIFHPSKNYDTIFFISTEELTVVAAVPKEDKETKEQKKSFVEKIEKWAEYELDWKTPEHMYTETFKNVVENFMNDQYQSLLKELVKNTVEQKINSKEFLSTARTKIEVATKEMIKIAAKEQDFEMLNKQIVKEILFAVRMIFRRVGIST